MKHSVFFDYTKVSLFYYIISYINILNKIKMTSVLHVSTCVSHLRVSANIRRFSVFFFLGKWHWCMTLLGDIVWNWIM